MSNAAPQGPQGRRTLKSIGLWGAPESGKTTFLAALYIAVNRSQQDLTIFGVNEESTEFLIQSTRTLTTDHRFPPGTMQDVSYSWTMNMNAKVQTSDRGRFGRTTMVTTVVPTQFNIDLRDAPGGWFGSQKAPTPSPQQQRLNLGGANAPAGSAPTASGVANMMDYLAGCDGLLLLIDPVREHNLGDAHDYFQGTLLRIAERKLTTMPPGAKLPHYVAVCVTKFDDPSVFGFARLKGYKTFDENDPHMFPRVHDDDAEIFFKDFCGTSDSSNAEMVCSALTRYFRPERVRYFVSSAIGFYLGASSRFRETDPGNSATENGIGKIRGKIYPINVLEPILWLGQQVAAG